MDTPPTAATLAAEETSTACNASRRPTFDLKFLWLATTLAAIVAALAPLANNASRVILAVYALTFLFGCWKTRRAMLFVLPAMYLPYGWVVVEARRSWRGYNLYWLGMFFQLPGLPFEMTVHPLSEFWLQLLTLTATLALFFVVLMLARPSRRMAIAASLVLSLVSLASSLLCYGVYRA